MKCNMAVWDRIFQFIFGVFMFGFAVAGGPIWFYSGIYFIACAAWGFSPLYVYFGVRTLKIKEH